MDIEKKIVLSLVNGIGSRITKEILERYSITSVPLDIDVYLSAVCTALGYIDEDDSVDERGLDRLARLGQSIQYVQLGRGGDSDEE